MFVCFANRNCSVTQLFWTFRHLITLFNWPWNTKIFSNRPFPTTSSFERAMATRLGFVDLSALNFDGTSILCVSIAVQRIIRPCCPFQYLYRCLKTCRTNGPIIFLFDESTAHQPAAHDYHLMSFLVDLMRFGSVVVPSACSLSSWWCTASQICPFLIWSSFPHRCINPTYRSVSHSCFGYSLFHSSVLFHSSLACRN